MTPENPEVAAERQRILADPDLLRFWNMVDQRADDECWPWAGGRDRQGYGHFWCDGKTHRAIRWLFERVARPLEPGELMRHTCDNPPCVNPYHLLPGSVQDNADDRERRGRHLHAVPPPRKVGVEHVNAVLTDDQVRAIRAEYIPGKVRQVDLATKYGVTQETISRITRGQGWTHLA